MGKQYEHLHDDTLGKLTCHVNLNEKRNYNARSFRGTVIFPECCASSVFCVLWERTISFCEKIVPGNILGFCCICSERRRASPG